MAASGASLLGSQFLEAVWPWCPCTLPRAVPTCVSLIRRLRHALPPPVFSPAAIRRRYPADASDRRPHLCMLQLTYKEGALSGQAIIRGAYINTASKDAGIDPDYARYRSAPIEGNGPLRR